MPISLPVCVKTAKVTGGKDVNIYYPYVSGMANKQFEANINYNIAKLTQSLIDQQSGNDISAVAEMIGSYEIKTNERNVLSVTISNYIYFDKAAHGMTTIKSLTFDMEKKQDCKMKDLFKENSNYKERLSEIIKRQIKDRKIDLLDDFTSVKDTDDFYLADKTIVIYYQLYELTPYYFGFPMFPISLYEIVDIINKDGPLERLAMNN